jgi:cytochrome c peroxidase
MRELASLHGTGMAWVLVIMISISSSSTQAEPNVTLPQLGEKLFFDTRLSANRTQSCTTCHNPEHAFTDHRGNSAGGATSLGNDNQSEGFRNTPTLSYAALTPPFQQKPTGDGFTGGLFHDGRAATLEDQAQGPLTNPIEMALSGPPMLSSRLQEDTTYIATFKLLFGNSVFDNPEQVLAATSTALGAFQRSPLFLPFDSKFDRHLRGEYTMTAAEDLGKKLFFSNLLNCRHCHLSQNSSVETFTDYSYHNIGVPPNIQITTIPAGIDLGLARNPAVGATDEQGKFKVPTLRNVAVTAPYMHNGVFKDLRTVLVFYNKYLISGTTNPETGEPWQAPEVPVNISLDLLQDGQPVSIFHIDALMAFLETLTDRRYEHLIPAHSPTP